MSPGVGEEEQTAAEALAVGVNTTRCKAIARARRCWVPALIQVPVSYQAWWGAMVRHSRGSKQCEPLRSRLPVTPAKEELGIAVGDFDTDLCVVGTVWVSDVHRDGAVFNNAVLGKEIVDDSLGRSGVACGIQVLLHTRQCGGVSSVLHGLATELLLYIGLLRKLDRHDVEARATQLLDVLGLNEAANELVADYSTGMRKKVALAAALLHSPSVLLLDEPFESVDPVSSKIIVDVLQHYRASGGTIVFSSHVMDTVERLCDHVAIVSAGKVERNGPIETLTDGGTTRLEDVFIDAVGASAEEAGDSLSWLGQP
ncbi:ABC transporter ATP-binding protein NatA [Nymphon striatum]|nr:ABC transporter ATP-binding protein NatA [Nymphon striatum]